MQTAIEMNSELQMQLSRIAGNQNYLAQTLDFLRSLVQGGHESVRVRGLAYQTILRRLSDFQEYEQGWDGENARPLNKKVVKNFKKVLEGSIDTQLHGWTIYPAANGSLLLEYQPREAGINIGMDDFSYYDFDGTQMTGENHCPFSPLAVLNIMKQIASHE